MRLAWLAEVLRASGANVIEEGNWYSRGKDEPFDPMGVMLHHDASAPGPSESMVGMLINGRPDLPGPLCQLWLDYWGTWHVIAGGRANHAGNGPGWGRIRADHGNSDAIGIETDHTTGEAWSTGQVSGGGRHLAALLAALGADPANALCGHKEYAPGRKVDPDPLDMGWLRTVVAAGGAHPENPEDPAVPAAPATCVDSRGRPWLFYRGTDGAAWARCAGDPPFTLGGNVTDGIAAQPGGDGRIDVYAYVPDGTLYGIHNDGSGWGSWYPVQ